MTSQVHPLLNQNWLMKTLEEVATNKPIRKNRKIEQSSNKQQKCNEINQSRMSLLPSLTDRMMCLASTNAVGNDKKPQNSAGSSEPASPLRTSKSGASSFTRCSLNGRQFSGSGDTVAHDLPRSCLYRFHGRVLLFFRFSCRRYNRNRREMRSTKKASKWLTCHWIQDYVFDSLACTIVNSRWTHPSTSSKTNRKRKEPSEK